MIRRLLIPLLGGSLLLIATAGSALAKCEGPNPPAFCSQVVASVDFGSGGQSLRAGIESPLRIWVTRGEVPAEATGVTLVFARIADSTVVRAVAHPSGEAGLWNATVELPKGGGWTLVAELDNVEGGLQRLSLDTIRVQEPLKPPTQQPPTPTQPTTPAPPSIPALPIALLFAGVAAAVVVASELRGRSRRAIPAS